MKMEQSIPKRRHIKFGRREIIQKKEYNIHNTAKVGNQDINMIFERKTVKWVVDKFAEGGSN